MNLLHMISTLTVPKHADAPQLSGRRNSAALSTARSRTSNPGAKIYLRRSAETKRASLLVKLKSTTENPDFRTLDSYADAVIEAVKNGEISEVKLLARALAVKEWVRVKESKGSLPSSRKELLTLARSHCDVWLRGGLTAEKVHLTMARRYYEEYLKGSGEHGGPHERVQLFKVLMFMGEYEEAARQIESVVSFQEADPQYANFLFYAGAVYKALGRFERANNLFFEATQVGPPNLFNNIEMMTIISRNLDEMGKADDEASENEDAYRMVHAHLVIEGHLPGNSDYDDWISDSQTWFNLADKCVLHQMFTLATDFYGLGIMRDPEAFKKPLLWFRFAKSWMRSGRSSDAQLAVKQALTRDPYQAQLRKADRIWSAEEEPNEYQTLVLGELKTLLEGFPEVSVPEDDAASLIQAFVRGCLLRSSLALGVGRRRDVRKMDVSLGLTMRLLGCEEKMYPLIVRAQASWGGSITHLMVFDIKRDETYKVKLPTHFAPMKERGVPRKLRLSLHAEKMEVDFPMFAVESLSTLDSTQEAREHSEALDQFPSVQRKEVVELKMQFTEEDSGHYCYRKVRLTLHEGTLMYEQPLYRLEIDDMSAGEVLTQTPDEVASPRAESEGEEKQSEVEEEGQELGVEGVGSPMSLVKSVTASLSPRPMGSARGQASIAPLSARLSEPRTPPTLLEADGGEEEKSVATAVVTVTDIVTNEIAREGVRWGSHWFLVRAVNEQDVTQVTLLQVRSNRVFVFLFVREHLDRSLNLRKRWRMLIRILEDSAQLAPLLEPGTPSEVEIEEAASTPNPELLTGLFCYVNMLPDSQGATIILVHPESKPILGYGFERLELPDQEELEEENDEMSMQSYLSGMSALPRGQEEHEEEELQGMYVGQEEGEEEEEKMAMSQISGASQEFLGQEPLFGGGQEFGDVVDVLDENIFLQDIPTGGLFSEGSGTESGEPKLDQDMMSLRMGHTLDDDSGSFEPRMESPPPETGIVVDPDAHPAKEPSPFPSVKLVGIAEEEPPASPTVQPSGDNILLGLMEGGSLSGSAEEQLSVGTLIRTLTSAEVAADQAAAMREVEAIADAFAHGAAQNTLFSVAMLTDMACQISNLAEAAVILTSDQLSSELIVSLGGALLGRQASEIGIVAEGVAKHLVRTASDGAFSLILAPFLEEKRREEQRILEEFLRQEAEKEARRLQLQLDEENRRLEAAREVAQQESDRRLMPLEDMRSRAAAEFLVQETKRLEEERLAREREAELRRQREEYERLVRGLVRTASQREVDEAMIVGTALESTERAVSEEVLQGLVAATVAEDSLLVAAAAEDFLRGVCSSHRLVATAVVVNAMQTVVDFLTDPPVDVDSRPANRLSEMELPSRISVRMIVRQASALNISPDSPQTLRQLSFAEGDVLAHVPYFVRKIRSQVRSQPGKGLLPDRDIFTPPLRTWDHHRKSRTGRELDQLSLLEDQLQHMETLDTSALSPGFDAFPQLSEEQLQFQRSAIVGGGHEGSISAPSVRGFPSPARAVNFSASGQRQSHFLDGSAGDPVQELKQALKNKELAKNLALPMPKSRRSAANRRNTARDRRFAELAQPELFLDGSYTSALGYPSQVEEGRLSTGLQKSTERIQTAPDTRTTVIFDGNKEKHKEKGGGNSPRRSTLRVVGSVTNPFKKAWRQVTPRRSPDPEMDGVESESVDFHNPHFNLGAGGKKRPTNPVHATKMEAGNLDWVDMTSPGKAVGQKRTQLRRIEKDKAYQASVSRFKQLGYMNSWPLAHSTLWEKKVSEFLLGFKGSPPVSLKKMLIMLQKAAPREINPEEAICALADAADNTLEVVEKLKDLEFSSELKLACRSLNVRAIAFDLLPEGAEAVFGPDGRSELVDVIPQWVESLRPSQMTDVEVDEDEPEPEGLPGAERDASIDLSSVAEQTVPFSNSYRVVSQDYSLDFDTESNVGLDEDSHVEIVRQLSSEEGLKEALRSHSIDKVSRAHLSAKLPNSSVLLPKLQLSLPQNTTFLLARASLVTFEHPGVVGPDKKVTKATRTSWIGSSDATNSKDLSLSAAIAAATAAVMKAETEGDEGALGSKAFKPAFPSVRPQSAHVSTAPPKKRAQSASIRRSLGTTLPLGRNKSPGIRKIASGDTWEREEAGALRKSALRRSAHSKSPSRRGSANGRQPIRRGSALRGSVKAKGDRPAPLVHYPSELDIQEDTSADVDLDGAFSRDRLAEPETKPGNEDLIPEGGSQAGDSSTSDETAKSLTLYRQSTLSLNKWFILPELLKRKQEEEEEARRSATRKAIRRQKSQHLLAQRRATMAPVVLPAEPKPSPQPQQPKMQLLTRVASAPVRKPSPPRNIRGSFRMDNRIDEIMGKAGAAPLAVLCRRDLIKAQREETILKTNKIYLREPVERRAEKIRAVSSALSRSPSRPQSPNR